MGSPAGGPLTRLTRHDVKFEWTEKCEKSFNCLRELLIEYPILRYPDPSKPYTIYTDASGIGWSRRSFSVLLAANSGAVS